MVDSNYIVEQGDKLTNGIWDDENFCRELILVKYEDDSHCVIEVDNDLYANAKGSNLDDNESEEKTVEADEKVIAQQLRGTHLVQFVCSEKDYEFEP